MTSDEMRALWTEAAAAFSDRDRLEEYLGHYADDIVFHGHGPEPIVGKEAVRELYAGVLGAFPDLRADVIETIGDEAASRLAVRYRCTGTHLGPFRGIAASGRAVDYEGVMFLRFADGRCVERWTFNDRLALMSQVGAVSVA